MTYDNDNTLCLVFVVIFIEIYTICLYMALCRT